MAIFTVTGDTKTEIGGAATDDRYVLNPFLVQPNQQITITDTGGSNIIQLDGDLEIASSSVTATAMQLTLSNGAVVTVLGADGFSFQTGGDGTTGAGGTTQSFSDFVTTGLGLAAVPTGNTPVTGGAVTVVEAGGTTGGGGTPAPFPNATFALAPDATSVAEGSIVTFTLITTNVTAGTQLPYTISGVSAGDITGPLSGIASVGVGGTASIAVQIAADQLTEGVETLTLSVNNGSASASTVIQDTSVAPAGNSYISGQGGNGVTSNYNIELVFEGAFSTDQRTAFEKAADYISALVTGDVPDVGMIDDIRIIAVIQPGDGLGGTLASAGPTALRPGSLLPSEGRMTFDTADANQELAAGTFADTVAHEMLHALGFGTIWEAADLNLLSETSGLRFIGPNAIAAYNAIFTTIAAGDPNSATGVPVETGGGEGTARGHWDEAIFTNEILTGFDDPVDFMSGMTVAALEDMGYDTIFDVGIAGAAMPQLTDAMFA